MKQKLPFFIALVLSMCVSIVSAQESNITIHVKMKDSLSVRAVRSHAVFGTMERVFPYAPKFEERHRKHGLHLWYQLRATDEQQGRALLDQLKSLPEVDKAEMALPQPLPRHDVKQVPEEGGVAKSRALVNDPLYSKQWHYQNSTTPNGIDINLEKAWALEQGSRDVVVAVMDEGIDVTHEDLEANLWINEAELNGKPGVDDDGNGYVDDIHGYNFYNNKGEIMPGNHGSHVAGTVAAINNNGTGGCGIAGGDGKNTGVRLMSCQILKSNSSARSSEQIQTDIAKAYVYAADMGAVVSQNSWAFKTSDTNIIADAVNYFMKEAGQYEGSPMKGGLVVWAASNDNTSDPASPHTNPIINTEQLIIVSALAQDGTKASFSNYGDWVHISAPGGDYGFQQILSTLPGNRYGYMKGTSMACPHVSGIAALVVSKFKNTSLTPQAVRHRILTSVNEVNRYNEGHLWQNRLGTGRVDAWKSLLENQHKAPQKATEVKAIHHTPRLVAISWLMAEDADDQSVHTCRVYRSTDPFTASNLPATFATLYTAELSAGSKMVYQTDSLLPNKQYYFAVEGIDRWGNRSELSEVISCRTDEKEAVIYSPYRYNTFYLREKDTVTLNFSVLAPDGMETELKISDQSSIAKITPTADGFELKAIAAERSNGVHFVTVVVTDKSTGRRTDTMELSFVIGSALPDNPPAPALRPGKLQEINLNQYKGELSFDLSEYFYDPTGLDFWWSYDKDSDTELDDFQHGMKGTLTGNILHVEYEFNLEFVSWGESNREIKVPVLLRNSYLRDNNVTFGLIYTGSVGMDEAELSKITLYPTVAEQQVSIGSAQEVEKVRFYTPSGVLCLEQNRPSSTVNVGTLAPGHYLVQLITAKGIVVRRMEKR